MKKLNLAVKTGLLMVAASLIFPTASWADTFGDQFSFTYDGCSGGCGVPAGTISVSGQGTNILTFDIDLDSTHYFHQNTGPQQTPQASFELSISGASVSSSNVSGITSGFGWAFIQPPGSIDALGTWGFGFSCNGSGFANTCGRELEFTLTFAAGTQAFVANETGGSHGDLTFGADLCLSNNGTSCASTGPVGATSGAPLPLAGAGLPGLVAACGALLAFARRRRQRNA
jgi:hypothetical protein